VAQGLLGKVLIIDLDVTFDDSGQVLGGVEAGGDQDVGDAAVEAFDHAVGLWGSGLGQAMLNAVVGADPIKDTGGGWLAFAGSTEAVSKRLAIIGKNLADRERSLVDQTLEEAASGGC